MSRNADVDSNLQQLAMYSHCKLVFPWANSEEVGQEHQKRGESLLVPQRTNDLVSFRLVNCPRNVQDKEVVLIARAYEAHCSRSEYRSRALHVDAEAYQDSLTDSS